MPNSKRKSKPRSEMTAEELADARAVDKRTNKDTPAYPIFKCSAGELSSLNAIWDYVNSTPPLRALILRADDHHRGREGGSGKDTPLKDKQIPRSTIQRLIVRSGLSNLLLDIPISIDHHLITLRGRDAHARNIYRRELRYLLLNYLHHQYPDATNALLTFSAGNPERLDMIIDYRLMSMLLIRPETSNLREWESRYLSVQSLVDQFRSHMPDNRDLLPFINPYSDTLNT